MVLGVAAEYFVLEILTDWRPRAVPVAMTTQNNSITKISSWGITTHPTPHPQHLHSHIHQDKIMVHVLNCELFHLLVIKNKKMYEV